MENRVGIDSPKKLKDLEYYLFNIKYHLIDEYFSFNENDYFTLEYFEKLHEFLFISIYDEQYCKIREDITEENRKKLRKLFLEIRELSYNFDSESFKEKIYKLWENQIFYDGNTRTILCFLKILSKVSNFKINYDFSKDVEKDYFIEEVLESISQNEKTI